MISVPNGALLSVPTMIAPNNYLSWDMGRLDPDDRDPHCGDDQGLTDEDTFIDLGPEWRDGASDTSVGTPPPDPAPVPHLPPPVASNAGGNGGAPALSMAPPAAVGALAGSLVSSMVEAIQLITVTLAAIGIAAVNKAGLFVRLGVALCKNGYRYIVDERRWVRRDDALGYHVATDTADIIGFIAEWALSNPLAAEQAWLSANIPQHDNPLVKEAIGEKYAAANANLTDTIPWRTTALKEMAGIRALRCKASDFDADPGLLNFPNGFLNLRTEEFTPHTKPHGQLFRNCTACGYDPAAECPRFLQYLNQAHPDDARSESMHQILPYLQYIAGTCLLGYPPPYRNGFWIFGPSTTGKSVFANTLRYVLGSYAMVLPAKLLMKTRVESRMGNLLAELMGKRMVCLSEVPDGQIDDLVFKELTSHDAFRARALYSNGIEIQPTHTLICTTNHRPIIDDVGGAMFERIRPIPFATRVQNPDPALESVLHAEAPGILNWMLEGARRVLAEPDLYRVPPAPVQECLNEYRQSMDIIGNFREACCEVCPSVTVTATRSLFAAFRIWAKENNQFVKMTERRFVELLREAGYESTRQGSGRRGNRLRGVSGLKINQEYTELLQRERHEIKTMTFAPGSDA